MASYTAQLLAAGFHPKLHLELNSLPTMSTCPLYFYQPVPASFILDRFELAQLHVDGFLGDSSEPGGLVVAGERNIENPADRAGPTSILVRLDSSSKGKGKTVELELPLHVRYQVPVERRWTGNTRNDMITLELPTPSVFYACSGSERESRVLCSSE